MGTKRRFVMRRGSIMKKRFVLISLMCICLALAGCGQESDDEGTEKERQSTENHDVLTDDNNPFEDDENEIYADDEIIILTDEDIYILSSKCGYIDNMKMPEDEVIWISTEDDLMMAENDYELAAPGEEYFQLAELFQNMKAEYSFEDYIYFIEYSSAGSGSYDYNVDKLVFDGEIVYFDFTDEAKNAVYGDSVTCDMSGWCYMAAVPRTLAEKLGLLTD